MSTKTAAETRPCEECRRQIDLPNEPPTHCNDLCWYLDKGRSLMKQIKAESATCSTCFGPVHETEVVPDHPNRNANPKRFQTPRAVRAVASTTDKANPRHWEVWGCRCGDVNPGRSEGVSDIAEIPHIAERRPDNLFAALERLAARGGIQTAPDRDRFDETVENYGGYLPLAAGYAVHGES